MVATELPTEKRTQGTSADAAGGTPAPAMTPSADAGAKEAKALSEEVQSLTRDIIAVEQETDAYFRKRGQFAVEEKAWLSVSREAPNDAMAGTLHDLREKLSAAEQDLNDTSLAEAAEALRLREANDRVWDVQEELEASRQQEKAAAGECCDLRAELREASRAAAAVRADVQELSESFSVPSSTAKAGVSSGGTSLGLAALSSVALPTDAVAAQKARSEAFFELAAARRSATAAAGDLRNCKVALSEARAHRTLQLEAASAGLVKMERVAEREALEGPVGSRLEAADRAYLESCQKSEELLKRVTTWRGLSSSSRARAEAAEVKAKRATQRQAVAESKAAEEQRKLEVIKQSYEEASQEQAKAQSDLEAARLWRQVASMALAVAIAFASARSMPLLGLAGR